MYQRDYFLINYVIPIDLSLGISIMMNEFDLRINT